MSADQRSNNHTVKFHKRQPNLDGIELCHKYVIDPPIIKQEQEQEQTDQKQEESKTKVQNNGGKVLKQGGGGTVRMATSKIGRKRVVIKEFHGQPVEEIMMLSANMDAPGVSSGNLSELWVSNSYKHPNLMAATDTLIDCNIKGKSPSLDAPIMMVMPYMETSLSDYYSELNKVDGDLRILLLHDILCGLEQLHATDLALLDLKPQNVLLFRDPEAKRLVAKIIDFGSVLPVTTGGEAKTNLVVENTELYCSPELRCNRKQPPDVIMRLSKAQDVWQIGIIALELAHAMELDQILTRNWFYADRNDKNDKNDKKIGVLTLAVVLSGELPTRDWFNKYDDRAGTCASDAAKVRGRSESVTLPSGDTSAKAFYGRTSDDDDDDALSRRRIYTYKNTDKYRNHAKEKEAAQMRSDPLRMWLSSANIVERSRWTKASSTLAYQFDSLIQFARSCLRMDPMDRPTVRALMKHDVFKYTPLVCQIDGHLGLRGLSSTDPGRFAGVGQLLTRQFAVRVLQNSKIAQTLSTPVRDVYYYAALLIAAKILRDPVLTQVFRESKENGISMIELLTAEKELIVLTKGNFTGGK